MMGAMMLTPEQEAETSSYQEWLRTFNPDLAGYRDQMPPEVRHSHMLLDHAYWSADAPE
jgi:hypothetical protein